MFYIVNTKYFKIFNDYLYELSHDSKQFLFVGHKLSNPAFNAITIELYMALKVARNNAIEAGCHELRANADEQPDVFDPHYKRLRKKREKQILDYANNYTKFFNAMKLVKHNILDAICSIFPTCSHFIDFDSPVADLHMQLLFYPPSLIWEQRYSDIFLN